jgi:predicted  nucleic acid-binding Zn-ribbon protein
MYLDESVEIGKLNDEIERLQCAVHELLWENKNLQSRIDELEGALGAERDKVKFAVRRGR